MNDPKTLETERLILRPFHPRHLPDLNKMYGDPQTMRFMPSPPHAAASVTEAQLKNDTRHPEAYYWVISFKGSDEVIGLVNYLGGTRVPGMGYIIRREFWGQGIAAEACRVALGFGFDEQGYDRVELWIDQTNLASQRVAQKLNFRLKGRLPLKYGHREQEHIMLVFGLWAHEWRRESVPKQATKFYRTEPVLFVDDVEETAVYYRDKLGFHIDFLFGDPPQHGGVSRTDWSGSGAVLQLAQMAPEREIAPSGYLYIFVSHDIDELFAAYKAQGVTIRSEPESYPWGLREFTIEDNNGHLLRFGTHV
ncbi:GNAT family N-acetyltransferase [Candidatus Leptofilum sp.]|uniref:GNAT family N-acetyltransferase n=1 Tax=Candidatus Leptofilum sp. TaxID=3241576 RepID=UPI003B5C15C5